MRGVARVAPFDRHATYADLEQLPPEVVAEIVDGELHSSPRPAPRHAHAASRLGGWIEPPFGEGRGGPGGWMILNEPEIHLGPDVVVPDLAGWRRPRMPKLPRTAYFAVASDWVCEVLSPSTVSLDRVKKLAIYAREGVSHAWLLDPIARTLEVLRLEAGRWTIVATYAGRDTVHAEPFGALGLELPALWGDQEGE